MLTVFRAIKLRRVSWVHNLWGKQEMRKIFLLENLFHRVGDLGVDGKKIPKLVLPKDGVNL
jgi:hypothetical protein